MSANDVIVFIIAAFFLLGIIDQAVFKGKMGFGPQMEAGIMQIGGLVLSLIGIMCFAPLLGNILTPIVSPLYNLIGADPANFPGILLGPDGGAFAMTTSMTDNTMVIALSGLFLASMLGVTICFSLPFALGCIEEKDKTVLSKGMLAGIIASPFGAVISGIIAGFPILFILDSLIPAFIIVVLLVIGLPRIPDKIIKGFLGFSKGISFIALVSLGFAAFELYTGIKIIPGLDSIGTKFTLMGYMCIGIAGALCVVHLLEMTLKKPLTKLGGLLKINDVAVLGIITTLANAMPVYSMIKDMDERGKLIVISFSVPACYAIGSHLAFAATMMPEYLVPEVVGKIICGVLASVIAVFLFDRKGEISKAKNTDKNEEPLIVAEFEK